MKTLITAAAALALLAATSAFAQTNDGASSLNARVPQSNNADQSTSPKGVTPNSTWYDGPALTNTAGEIKSVNTASADERRARERREREAEAAADTPH